jgi:predicted CXXCH cytochrome family protein
MKEVLGDRGGMLITALAVLAVVMLSMAIYGMRHEAEAVLGGEGNLVANTSNKHNFAKDSAGVEATDETRICIFCHTPHNASMDSSLINGPLWNHQLSDKSFASAKWGTGVYNTPPVSNAVGYVNVLTVQPDQPDGTSRMCLSCHDGTIGIGNIVSGSAITMDTSGSSCLDADGSMSSSCYALVNDLSTKHIVSIPMNQALIDNSALSCVDGSQSSQLSFPWGGNNPQSSTVLLRPTLTTYDSKKGVGSGFPNSKYRSGYNYGVQCSTCHDPHYWTTSGVGYKFLVTQTKNALCQACHDLCP